MKYDVKRFMIVPTKEEKPGAQQLALLSKIEIEVRQLKTLNETAQMKNLLDFIEREAQREKLTGIEKEIVKVKFVLLDKTGELIEGLKQDPDFGKPGPAPEKRSVQSEPISSPKTLREAGISKRESVKAQQFHNLPEPEKADIITKAVERVGTPRKRRKIIESSNPPVYTTGSGKPVDVAHIHIFNRCACGALESDN